MESGRSRGSPGSDMSQSPLTQQERDVLHALSIGRPKRYLHVYFMMGIGALFLCIAGYKALTRSSDAAARVAERPGPKAAAQEPSAAVLKELIEKQSRGAAAATTAPAITGSVIPPSGTPSFASAAPAITGSVIPPFAYPSPATKSSTASLQVVVPQQVPSPPPELSDLDHKLVEASYMTAKTDVYVQSAQSWIGSEGARTGPSDAEQLAAVAKQLAAANKAVPDTHELGRLVGTAKPTVEDRINARAR